MTWQADEFGQAWADVYDEAFAHMAQDADEAAGFISTLVDAGGAAGPRLLELGVGTGRLAVPLARNGFEVTGLDASPLMLERLRANAADAGPAVVEAITGVLGDMAAPPVAGHFDVVLIGFNTLFALPDQESQIRCIAACAHLLARHGRLVIEANVPQPWRFTGETTAHDGPRDDQVALELTDHDPVTQTVRSARVLISDRAGIRTLPLKVRYAWPSEIDLMARLGGLRLTDRFAGWERQPFDAESARHISVFAHATPHEES